MNIYSREQTSNIHEQHFAYLIIKEEDHILRVTLNRPAKKNALHPQMVNELAYAFQYAHYNGEVRVITLDAAGDIFCAGGDLKAMAGFIEENDSTIPIPLEEVLLGEIFNKVFKPIVSIVQGDVFAGGFLILAGCQYVIAQKGLSFGLPEVKRGIFPMQVMESLLKIMPSRLVIDWCIRGYSMSAEKACEHGLLTHVVEKDEIADVREDIITSLKNNSPKAISLGLEAYDHIQPSANNHKYLNSMLVKAIQSEDGQEGLLAYREKRDPIWTGR